MLDPLSFLCGFCWGFAKGSDGWYSIFRPHGDGVQSGAPSSPFGDKLWRIRALPSQTPLRYVRAVVGPPEFERGILGARKVPHLNESGILV